MTLPTERPEDEAMARMACADHGYQFGALVVDLSGDEPVPGFTYTVPGQDVTAPNWVSFRKSCWKHWDGSAGA